LLGVFVWGECLFLSGGRLVNRPYGQSLHTNFKIHILNYAVNFDDTAFVVERRCDQK
jgi:hypothetical protein